MVTIASQSFELETPGGQYFDTGDSQIDHDLVNNPGQSPVDSTAASAGTLGFDARYENTRSSVGLTDGDFVGVTSFTGQVGAYTDGSQGYELSDTDGKMSVDFASIDLSGFSNVSVSIDYFLNETGWEIGDSVSIEVATDLGTFTLLDTSGLDIDDLNIEGSFTTLNIGIPDGATTAQLTVALDSNSSSENLYVDNVVVTGDVDAPPRLSSLVFNEVLADPNSGSNNFDTDGDGTAETQDEFIELYNTSAGTVDVSGLQFWDAGTDNFFTVPAGSTLGPNGFLVVVGDIDGGSLPSVPAGSLAFSTGGASGINNGGDNLVVYDPDADTFIQALYNGDSQDDPAASYDGFSATATRVGAVQDMGSDTDGVSLALSPDGDTANPVRHNTIGTGATLATPGNANADSPVVAAFDLQITELFAGNQPGDNLSSDWIEITNLGDAAWVSSVDGALFYDDVSADPSEADLINDISQIDPGEAVVVAIGDAADATALRGLWAEVFQMAPVQIGWSDGAGLGQGGDAAALFLDPENDGLGIADTAFEVESYPDATANGGESYDVTAAAFSVDGTSGALTTNTVNDQGQPAVGSPGNADPVQAATLVSAVQGAGDTSPLVGNTVTVRAVVVGDFQDGTGTNGDLNGFYLQEEDADQDADTQTSEGIFVFDGSSPAVDVNVGDIVEVTGTVAEFFGETQLSSISAVTVLASGQSSQTTAATVSFPVASSTLNSDGEVIADLEAYEGMLVTIPQEMTVSTLFGFGRFGEIGLFGGSVDAVDGRLPIYTQTNAPDATGAGIAAYEDAAARSTVFLDDANLFQNPEVIPFEANGGPNGTTGDVAGQYDANDELRSGDTVTGLTGVVRYSRASGGSGDEIFRINAVEDVTIVNENPCDTVPEVDGRLKVASLNVLNFFTTINDDTSFNNVPLTDAGLEPRGANDLTTASSSVAPSTQAANDPNAEFQRQLDKLVAQIAGLDADVLGLLELENSASDAALDALVDAINASALTTRTYDYVSTGLVGTDAITTGFIYDIASIGLVGDEAVLDTAAFTDPNGTGQGRNRPAVAQTFEELATGETFTAAVNHLKSKGASGLSAGTADPDSDQGDGQAFWNDTRTKAATELANWLASDPTGSGDDDFLILGDLNAYAMEDPLTALAGAGYTDLAGQFGTGLDYSYAFPISLDTSSTVQAYGTLDYGLANSSLLAQVTGAAEWHTNADEPGTADYNLEFKPQGQADGFYGPNAFRSSDHDPLLIGLNLGGNAAPVIGAVAPAQVRELAKPGTVVADVDATDADGGTLTFAITSGNTDGAFAIDTQTGLITVASRGALGEGAGPFALGVEVSDGQDTDNTTVEIAMIDLPTTVSDDRVIVTQSADDAIVAGGSDNLVLAGAGADVVLGSGGDDSLMGQDGADDLVGGQGDDLLSGGAGNDCAHGGAGEDRVLGGGGADTVRGGADDDLIKGGRGDDLIFGGAGDDTLKGGPGADTFAFDSGFGNDTIRVFDADEDILDFGTAIAGMEKARGGVLFTVDGEGTVLVRGLSLDEVLLPPIDTTDPA